MLYQVREYVGPYGITLADGEALYKAIYPHLEAGRVVELDFTGVEVVASPFLNAALGALLATFTSDDLNRLVKVDGLSPTNVKVLRRVIENAKQYYQDPAARRAVDALLEDQAEAV